MSEQGWLALTEYSRKHGVSISTLRRRIKGDQIEYQFTDGKYFLKDAPLETKRKTPEPRKVTTAPPQQSSGHLPDQATQTNEQGNSLPGQFAQSEEMTKVDSPSPSQEQDAVSVLAHANNLVNELKKAYSVVLHEKEEQIIYLKEEVADLKTLVRVLEEETERLKGSAQQSANIDGWLKSFD